MTFPRHQLLIRQHGEYDRRYHATHALGLKIDVSFDNDVTLAEIEALLDHARDRIRAGLTQKETQ